MEVIQSADIDRLSDSTADALLSEINSKRNMMAVWPIPLAAMAALTLLSFSIENSNALMQTVACVSLVVTALATIWLYLRDTARRSMVLFYDLEPHARESYENLIVWRERFQLGQEGRSLLTGHAAVQDERRVRMTVQGFQDRVEVFGASLSASTFRLCSNAALISAAMASVRL